MLFKNTIEKFEDFFLISRENLENTLSRRFQKRCHSQINICLNCNPFSNNHKNHVSYNNDTHRQLHNRKI